MKIAIAGGTGYSGQELLKLLRGHPQLEVAALLGRESNFQSLDPQIKLAILCTPNEVSLDMAPRLLERGISVIDVSGVFRLKKHSYSEWYGLEHTQKAWLQKSEYGLFPWHKVAPLKDGECRLVANPGCFVTSVLMPLLPVLKSGMVDEQMINIDSKSGTSGAGRKAETKLLFSEIFGDFAPYKIGKHQHWPEIVEFAEVFSHKKINPVFVTGLLPVERGISSNLFFRWTAEAKNNPRRLEELLDFVKNSYKDNPDIFVGSEAELLNMKKVCHSNHVHIFVAEAFGQPLLVCSIDNLLRGAAGQALMNANLLAGVSPFQNLEITLKT